MGKYNFKLQKLLDIREKEEEESKLNYSKIQNEKNKIENNLNNLKQNYSKYSNINDTQDIITQNITIKYLSTLTTSIKSNKEKLSKEKEKLQKAKEDLIQKQINRKTLETLKEKQIAKLKKEEERVEQLTNDEFALYSYIRKNTNFS